MKVKQEFAVGQASFVKCIPLLELQHNHNFVKIYKNLVKSQAQALT